MVIRVTPHYRVTRFLIVGSRLQMACVKGLEPSAVPLAGFYILLHLEIVSPSPQPWGAGGSFHNEP